MTTPHSLARAATILLVTATTPLLAQGFLPFGQPQGGGNNTLIGPLDLGFSFTFPDGTATTQISVDTNGRIFPGASGTSLPIEQEATFLAGPSSLAPYWDDLTVGNLHFQSSATIAVVTWPDVTETSASTPMTMQVQLRPGGDFSFVYDPRSLDLAGDALVGYTTGGGASSIALDLSATASPGIAPSTLLEIFPIDEFDLSNGSSPTTLEFERLATGEYLVTGHDLPPRARVEFGRRACEAPPRSFIVEASPVVLTFTEGGTPDLDYAEGTPLALALDEVTPPLPMNFTFVLPNGIPISSLVVDSNGRVLEPVAGEFSDFTPSIAEFLDDPLVQICPLWADFDVPLSPGNVWFHAAPTFTSVTWERIVQFTGFRPQTFQVVLRNDDSIEFHYLDVELDIVADAILGVSTAGFAPDPGPIDISSGFGSGNLNVVYEAFLPATIPGAVEYDLDDRADDQVSLSVSAPRLGDPVGAGVFDSTGTATTATYLVGFPSGVFAPPIDLGTLSPLLANCQLLVEATVASPFIVVTGPVSAQTLLFTVPDDLALAGVGEVSVSAIVVNPNNPPLFQPTNERILRFGL